MKKKILIVEDEVIIADDLCNILSKLDYEVLELALSYKEALTRLAEEDVDLAVLDIQLGGKKTGIDVANYIRANTRIPFIYLTSYSDSRTLELAKTTMPYGYLVKPFESADVFTALEIALNNHSRYKSDHDGNDKKDLMPEFTKMEKVVLRKITENMATKEIADHLSVSQSTIKNHRHNICVKLDLPAGTHSLMNWVLRNKESLLQ